MGLRHNPENDAYLSYRIGRAIGNFAVMLLVSAVVAVPLAWWLVQVSR